MTGGSIMPPHQRDDSLDILKGIGCLTMVIAHQPYVFQKPDIALGLINHIAGILPPAVFFSVSGITASLQASRYTLRSLTLYFMALFLIGFSWNIIIHGDSSAFYWPEIFQIIAIGSLLVCFVECKFSASQSLLFFASIFLLLSKPLVDYLWPNADGWHLLLCDRNYVPELEADPKISPLLPGFPLLPWAGFFFLGAWCYRAGKQLKLLMAMLALGLAFLSVTFGSSAVEKWNSSIAYIFSSCAAIGALLWLFSGYSHARSALAEQLRKLGSNAFLFFFSHPLGIVAGVIVYLVSKNAYIAWLISIIVAVLIYNFLNRVKPWPLFQSAYAWLVMTGAIFILPFLPRLIEHKSLPLITRVLAVFIGIVAAINFSSLAALTKQRKPLQQNLPGSTYSVTSRSIPD
jgi:hypothetical protein